MAKKRMVPTFVTAHTCMFCASRGTQVSYGRCLPIPGYFCVVQNYVEKAELSKCSWYPKRKLGVTMHFSEIIKLQFAKKKKNQKTKQNKKQTKKQQQQQQQNNNAIHCFVFYCSFLYFTVLQLLKLRNYVTAMIIPLNSSGLLLGNNFVDSVVHSFQTACPLPFNGSKVDHCFSLRISPDCPDMGWSDGEVNKILLVT